MEQYNAVDFEWTQVYLFTLQVYHVNTITCPSNNCEMRRYVFYAEVFL